MEGWIKLHRKIIESSIFQDGNAFRVFIWILTTVDYKTGKKTTGRFLGAALLDMNPSTFRNALYRLRDKYKAILLKSDNKKTEISVLRWDKYQSGQNEDTSEDTKNSLKNSESRTERGQQEDNKRTHYKELRSKEYINILPAKAGTEQIIPLMEKKERKLTPYQELITYCRLKQGINQEYVNYIKQTTAIKKILYAGYSIEDARFVIEEMAQDPYWQGSPFDLMTVANQMHKYMNRTIYFKKGGKYGNANKY